MYAKMKFLTELSSTVTVSRAFCTIPANCFSKKRKPKWASSLNNNNGLKRKGKAKKRMEEKKERKRKKIDKKKK